MKDKKTLDDMWAKENGVTLRRDSCESCRFLWERGDTNRLGETMFCSPVHAYEVSNLKKENAYEAKRQMILSAINTEILSLEDAKKIIDDIEERYY